VATLFAFPIAIAIFWLAAAALLWPAYVVAGGSTKRPWSYLFNTLLGLFATLLFLIAVTFALSLGGSNLAFALIMSPIAVLTAALCGVVVAHILNSLSPAQSKPLVASITYAAIGGVGAAGLLIRILSGGYGPNPLGWLVILLWIAAPAGLYYHAAFAQRKKLRRHLRAQCIRCGYAGAAPLDRCPECGDPPPILCHRCRRFSSAAPGVPCPHCRATLGRRCWRCQYDWSNLAPGPRCPECGIWRPAESSPEPEASPA